MCCWVKEQLDQGTAGESEKQHGGVGVDGFVCKVVLCCVCFWCGLAWLPCLPAGVGVVYESLWWGGMWCGWVAKRGLCWATRRCTCQYVREGHRTHQTTILLSFFFPFHLACKVPSCLLVLTSPRHGKGDDDGDRRSIFFNVCASV